MTPRVKICCISSREEAWTAIGAGASALGLVSAMPSGPGVIDEALIPSITRVIPPGIASFLLTSAQDPQIIIAQQRSTRVNVVQLVDELDPQSYRILRAALPGIGLVGVVHVTGNEALQAATSVAPLVDALLLDSGNPALQIKELGGTGRVHDWEISRAIRDTVPVPVYLAGGLNASNVAHAIQRVRPFGVDICSGVRTDGALDGEKLTAFMQAIRGGW